MGLLDDAIREHLDLKRRRGADPTEIARLEQEALGPVRREPEPAAHEDAHPKAEPREPVHHGAVAEEPAHDEHEDVALPQEERLFEAPEPEHEPVAEVRPEPEPAKVHGDALLHPTTEYRVEDHLDEEDEPEAAAPAPTVEELDEDVLEETPDFLQETPEHDRLWFEQRPPRDFDFDG